MRSTLAKVAMYGLGIATVAAMIIYLLAQREVIGILREVSLLLLLLLLALGGLGILNYGGRFRTTCRVFDVNLGYWQGVGLAATNSMLNYAIPLQGGMVLRATYMKQQFGLSYTNYGGLIATSQLISVATAGIWGLVVAAITEVNLGVVPAGFFVAFGGAAAVSILSFAAVDLVDFTRLKPAAIGRRLQAFSVGFTQWRRHPTALLRYASSAVVSIAIGTLRLAITFAALRIDAPLLPVALVAAAVWLAGTLPITPGNLGVNEGVTMLTAGLLGIDARLALLAALVDRAATIAVVFGIGLPFSHTFLLSGRRSRRNQEPGEPSSLDRPQLR